MRLRRNQLCPFTAPSSAVEERQSQEKNASARWAFGASKTRIIPGDTGNSAPTAKCGNSSTGRLPPNVASAHFVTNRSMIMATSYPTISIPAAWAGHGETTTRRTFRQFTGGATGKRDRAEYDLQIGAPFILYLFCIYKQMQTVILP